mgnify:CR=1 FL=1
MIPTVIRSKTVGNQLGVVITTLGSGKLEARFHVYKVGPQGQTYLDKDTGVWSSEQAAIDQWYRWSQSV